LGGLGAGWFLTMQDLLGQVERRLAADLSIRMHRVQVIEPGRSHNNRLFHVWAADGRQAVVKVYFPDDRFRLDREYSAIALLHKLGVLRYFGLSSPSDLPPRTTPTAS
jgi:hypothetical protein